MGNIASVFVFVLFVTTIVLTGCEKEVIVEKEVEKIHSWTVMPEFTYDEKIQLNSYGDSSNLYLMNHSTISIINQPTSNGRMILSQYLLFMEPSLYDRFPLCGLYYAVAAGNTVCINLSKDPMGYYSDVWLYMEQVDSKFLQFDFPSRSRSDAIGINGSNSILIPYLRSDSTYMKHAAMLVTFSVTDYYSTKKMDTISTAIITFGYDDSPYGIYHYNDHYFYSGYRTYRITSSGTFMVSHPAPLYNMFSVNNDLYAMSFGKILRSKDTGANWQEIGHIPYEFEILSYRNVDGTIIAHRLSQLFKIVLNDSINTIEELDNDGLDGHKITSVSRYRDNFFVTTQSGVFSRPAQKFFTPKYSSLKKRSFFQR